MMLCHILVYTIHIQLAFGLLASVTRLVLFSLRSVDAFRFFFKEPAEIENHAFEAFSRGCILLEFEMMFSFYNVQSFL